MDWTDEQKENILRHYRSIEEYEYMEAKRQAERYLAETDYIVIKAYEYAMTGAELDKDYTEIFEKREEARNVLRNLEKSEIEEESNEETEESENETTVEESNEIEETENSENETTVEESNEIEETEKEG